MPEWVFIEGARGGCPDLLIDQVWRFSRTGVNGVGDVKIYSCCNRLTHHCPAVASVGTENSLDLEGWPVVTQYLIQHPSVEQHSEVCRRAVLEGGAQPGVVGLDFSQLEAQLSNFVI